MGVSEAVTSKPPSLSRLFKAPQFFQSNSRRNGSSLSSCKLSKAAPAAARDEASKRPECLAHSSHRHIDTRLSCRKLTSFHKMLDDAAACGTQNSSRMGFIQHQQTVICCSQCGQSWKIGHISIHAEDRIADKQPPSSSRRFSQQAFQMIEVPVPIDKDPCAAESARVDD